MLVSSHKLRIVSLCSPIHVSSERRVLRCLSALAFNFTADPCESAGPAGSASSYGNSDALTVPCVT